MCEFCKHHCWVGINYCPKCGRKANRMSDNLDKIITNVIEAEKNGVKIIIKQQYDREINDINIDFSEHDKKFNDKIASLKKQIEKLESIHLEVNDMPLDEFIVKVDGVAEFLKREIRICDKRLEEKPSPYYDGVNVGFTNAQELNINHIRFCKKLLEMMNFEQ